ncbi:MAG: hypothetical protein ACTSRG_04330 [Candidatus Helarchaeota archaeon]
MALPSGELNPNYLIQDIRVGVWLVAISFLFLFAKDFFYRSRNAELQSQKKIFLGYAIFFTLYAITRIVFLISDYSYLHFFSWPINNGGFLFQVTWQIASIIGLIGFTTLVFYIENYLLEKKTKLVFSFIGLGLIAITSVVGIIARSLIYIFLIIMGVVPVLLYFYFANLTEGEMKKKAILSGLALTFILGGIGLDSKFMQNIMFPLNIPIKIIGTLIVIFGLILFNQQYSHYDQNV